MTWICSECGAKMKLAQNLKPKMCCSCGSDKLVSPESTERLATYRKYDDELIHIADKLNELREKEKPIHARYTEIMQYFRQQKTRKLITEDEYRARADRFEFLKRRKK